MVILQKRLRSLISLINPARPAVQNVDQSRSGIVVMVTVVAVGLRVVRNGGGNDIFDLYVNLQAFDNMTAS